MQMFLEAVSQNLFMVVVGTCVIVAIVVKGLTTIVTSSARERSRREIAAYIAEGSISAEQGERLMQADVDAHQDAA